MRNNTSLKNIAGMTLIELMIAIALFVGLMAIAAAVFTRAVDNQGVSSDLKNLQEGLQYGMGVMGNEISGAKQDRSGCGPCVSGDFFCVVDGNNVYFKNRDDVCVRYFLSDDVQGAKSLVADYGGTVARLTPSDITLNGLAFTSEAIADTEYPAARLTFSLSGRPVNSTDPDATIVLQTSLMTPLPLPPAQALSANDVQRLADVNSLRDALEAYHAVHSEYPQGYVAIGTPTAGWSLSDNGFSSEPSGTTYLAELPTPPDGIGTYGYRSHAYGVPQTFIIAYKLDSGSGCLSWRRHRATPVGVYGSDHDSTWREAHPCPS